MWRVRGVCGSVVGGSVGAVKVSLASPSVMFTFLAAAEMVTESTPPPMPTVPEVTAALIVRVSSPSKALTLMDFPAVPAAAIWSAPEVPVRVEFPERVVTV